MGFLLVPHPGPQMAQIQDIYVLRTILNYGIGISIYRVSIYKYIATSLRVVVVYTILYIPNVLTEITQFPGLSLTAFRTCFAIYQEQRLLLFR